MDKKLRQGTLCVQAGYKAKNGEPIELPIIQSTTFKYDDSDEMAKLFDLCKTLLTMLLQQRLPHWKVAWALY